MGPGCFCRLYQFQWERELRPFTTWPVADFCQQRPSFTAGGIRYALYRAFRSGTSKKDWVSSKSHSDTAGTNVKKNQRHPAERIFHFYPYTFTKHLKRTILVPWKQHLTPLICWENNTYTIHHLPYRILLIHHFFHQQLDTSVLKHIQLRQQPYSYLGKWSKFDEHICQNGWVAKNHQLVTAG